jgi:hypothetical protein
VGTQPIPPQEVVANPNALESSLTYVQAVQAIQTPANRIPVVGKPSNKFSGAFETVVRRPLIVVSEPNFADPDQWKAAGAPTELAKPIHVAFGQAYRHVRLCDTGGEPLKSDWELSRSDLSIVKAYASNKGSFLVETRLKSQRCAFDVNGKDLTNLAGTQWFFVAADRTIRSLGSDRQLVDAGDYDADGKSEVVFFFGDSESGKEGYTLFYDDFRGQVTWSYR